MNTVPKAVLEQDFSQNNVLFQTSSVSFDGSLVVKLEILGFAQIDNENSHVANKISIFENNLTLFTGELRYLDFLSNNSSITKDFFEKNINNTTIDIAKLNDGTICVLYSSFGASFNILKYDRVNKNLSNYINLNYKSNQINLALASDGILDKNRLFFIKSDRGLGVAMSIVGGTGKRNVLITEQFKNQGLVSEAFNGKPDELNNKSDILITYQIPILVNDQKNTGNTQRNPILKINKDGSYGILQIGINSFAIISKDPTTSLPNINPVLQLNTVDTFTDPSLLSGKGVVSYTISIDGTRVAIYTYDKTLFIYNLKNNIWDAANPIIIPDDQIMENIFPVKKVSTDQDFDNYFGSEFPLDFLYEGNSTLLLGSNIIKFSNDAKSFTKHPIPGLENGENVPNIYMSHTAEGFPNKFMLNMYLNSPYYSSSLDTNIFSKLYKLENVTLSESENSNESNSNESNRNRFNRNESNRNRFNRNESNRNRFNRNESNRNRFSLPTFEQAIIISLIILFVLLVYLVIVDIKKVLKR